ncbi:hypothetical protein KQX54_019211 [Cotesia glomerata]|uniref:PilZ domain-containing protein n=1 Tax=Cotesia glomerata TaxID=32391 RepID=A0AAV7IF74_COTGL|nr:hypothetical protein KQX54_019211 [Cotesia glomerata]
MIRSMSREQQVKGRVLRWVIDWSNDGILKMSMNISGAGMQLIMYPLYPLLGRWYARTSSQKMNEYWFTQRYILITGLPVRSRGNTKNSSLSGLPGLEIFCSNFLLAYYRDGIRV